MGGSEETTLSDLKGELASLRIDRDRPAKAAWRWPLLLLLPVFLLLAACTPSGRAMPSVR